MRFVVDHQLPPALARLLQRLGHEADHVTSLGLDRAADRLICDYAVRNRAVVVSKDDDMVRIARTRADLFVVWVRTGNCSTRDLLGRFEAALPHIEARLTAGDLVIEVR